MFVAVEAPRTMTIHWIPKNAPDQEVDTLIKLEYSFRQAFNKHVLKHLDAETEDEDFDLSVYEFYFDITTRKFSLAPETAARTPILLKLCKHRSICVFF